MTREAYSYKFYHCCLSLLLCEWLAWSGKVTHKHVSSLPSYVHIRTCPLYHPVYNEHMFSLPSFVHMNTCPLYHPLYTWTHVLSTVPCTYKHVSSLPSCVHMNTCPIILCTHEHVSSLLSCVHINTCPSLPSCVHIRTWTHVLSIILCTHKHVSSYHPLYMDSTAASHGYQEWRLRPQACLTGPSSQSDLP